MAEESMFSVQPFRRTGHVAVTYNKCMLVWGGYKNSTDDTDARYLPGSELWVFDPLAERWQLKPCEGSAPPGTSGATAIVVSDSLYIFGGYRDNGNTNDLYRLDLDSLMWEYVVGENVPPVPCDKLVGWHYRDKLFFFGGFGVIPTAEVNQQKGFQFVVDESTPWHYRRGWNNQFVMFDPETSAWKWLTYEGTAPLPRAAHAAARISNRVYIFGGRYRNTRMNDTHCIDMTTLTWSGSLPTRGPQPRGRSWHSLTGLSSERLVLYGGFSQNSEPLSDCWLLELSSLTWVQVALPFQKPRLWHSAVLSPFDEVLIYGGCTQNILDQDIIPEHAGEIIILRFTPKSLFRICLDRTIQCEGVLRCYWPLLPNSVQQLLRSRLIGSRHTSLGGS
ncbi:kelch domain-containing protein 2-like isoform X1 [Tachypleus tridentatus]|uniref:kelch domain-containing protein 2-like isoform X1 n=1 Tax=Tachypleus tridentatus TaxID=6853 RepID=UPI003FD36F98